MAVTRHHEVVMNLVADKDYVVGRKHRNFLQFPALQTRPPGLCGTQQQVRSSPVKNASSASISMWNLLSSTRSGDATMRRPFAFMILAKA